jgi:hypothetical protein
LCYGRGSIDHPHLASAAIAAAAAAFAKMISASVFRTVHANGFRNISANGTNKRAGIHLAISWPAWLAAAVG